MTRKDLLQGFTTTKRSKSRVVLNNFLCNIIKNRAESKARVGRGECWVRAGIDKNKTFRPHSIQNRKLFVKVLTIIQLDLLFKAVPRSQILFSLSYLISDQIEFFSSINISFYQSIFDLIDFFLFFSISN